MSPVAQQSPTVALSTEFRRAAGESDTPLEASRRPGIPYLARAGV